MFTHEGDEDRTDHIIQQWPGEHIPVLLTRAKNSLEQTRTGNYTEKQKNKKRQLMNEFPDTYQSVIRR